jgi:hypothetical protein
MTNDRLGEIDSVMAARAQRITAATDRQVHADESRQAFLAGFATACEQEIRPAMQAVIDRLRRNGGGGEIDVGHGGPGHPSDPRLTLWMSLDGEIVGHPRPDRQPYLQLDGDSSIRAVHVTEGDMWQGHGGNHSGRVADWQLTEITGELVTTHVVKILGRAASGAY